MTGDTRATAEPALGEQAIAQAVANEPGPLTTDREDGMGGGGREDAQAVAQAHVYRILTGRSHFDLERHFDRYPTIRDSLGLESNLDHSSFAYSMREQFEGMEAFFESYADYVRDRIEARLPDSLTGPHLAEVDVEDDSEPLPEIPEAAKDEKIRHVRAIMLEETDFDRASNVSYEAGSILTPFLEAAQEADCPANVISDNDHDFAIKTAFNAVKQRDATNWHEEFQRVNGRVLSAATGAGMVQASPRRSQRPSKNANAPSAIAPRPTSWTAMTNRVRSQRPPICASMVSRSRSGGEAVSRGWVSVPSSESRTMEPSVATSGEDHDEPSVLVPRTGDGSEPSAGWQSCDVGVRWTLQKS